MSTWLGNIPSLCTVKSCSISYNRFFNGLIEYGDLETVVRLGLKIIIIVVNNSANGLIKRFQLSKHKRNHGSAIYFSPVDFAKLAEANGCMGISVKNLEEFSEALHTADLHNGPVLIDLPIHYPKMYIHE